MLANMVPVLAEPLSPPAAKALILDHPHERPGLVLRPRARRDGQGGAGHHRGGGARRTSRRYHRTGGAPQRLVAISGASDGGLRRLGIPLGDPRKGGYSLEDETMTDE